MTRNFGLIGLGMGCLVSFAAIGCGGTYRVVEKTSTGGVVALPNAQTPRENVEQYLKAQCPAGYDVQKESEQVIGETTNTNEKGEAHGNRRGGVSTSSATSSTTTQKTEWRIEYKCKDAAGAPPAPPADDKAKTDEKPKTSSETHVLIVRY
jgi:hypothetical protein